MLFFHDIFDGGPLIGAVPKAPGAFSHGVLFERMAAMMSNQHLQAVAGQKKQVNRIWREPEGVALEPHFE